MMMTIASAITSIFFIIAIITSVLVFASIIVFISVNIFGTKGTAGGIIAGCAALGQSFAMVAINATTKKVFAIAILKLSLILAVTTFLLLITLYFKGERDRND